MDLREFMFRKELKSTELAELLGCNSQCFVHLKKRKSSPQLLTALKLLFYADGEIKPEELLSHEQYEEYMNWLGKKPKKD